MKRKNYIIVVLLFILILIGLNKKKLYDLLMDMNFYLKGNATAVSKEYNINLKGRSNSFKNYFHWGIEKESSREKYIFFVWRKGTYIIYGDEGISLEKAKMIAKENGFSAKDVFFYIKPSFPKNLDLKDYLYWNFIKEDDTEIYIKFNNGDILSSAPE